MSDAAPEVTFSLPKIISSATRPPIMMARREVICSRLIDSLSRSGSCMTMPSARPRGMIVALWTGSVAGDVERDDGVAGLVIGGQPLLVLGHDQGAPLGAHHHLVLGVLELGHRDEALAAPGGEQRRLVDEVHQVGAGEAGRAARDRLEVDVGRQRHLAHMHLQDLLAADDVRDWARRSGGRSGPGGAAPGRARRAGWWRRSG